MTHLLTLEAARILIADDLASNIALLEDLLSSAGYHNIQTTTNPRQVVPLYASFSPDILLLDLHMPDHDGFAVMAELVPRIPPYDFFPILVLTADVTQQARERALAIGAKDFITKPFERTEVLLRIKNLLATRALHLQLKAQNALLEQRVAERTAKLRLALDRLEQQADALAEAARVKSQFLATISHELRTPLTAVLGYAELLLQEALGDIDPDQRWAIEAIHDAGRRHLELVNSILNLSLIEANRFEMRPQPLEVPQIITAIVDAMRPLAQSKGLSLTAQLSANLPPLWCDPAHTRQALLCLVDNAIKFTQHGGVVVRAWAEPEAVHLSVEDTGPGVPAGAQDIVWEDFRQIDQSDTRRHNGAGLGLSLARRLILLMRGSIWLEQTPGEGAAFHIRLPSALALDTAADGGPGSYPAPASVGADDHPLILVADGDPPALDLARRHLQAAGYRVATLADGRLVVPEARRLQPSAIVLELLLPQRDGWQVLQELKSDPQTERIPIVITSILDEHDLASALAAAYLVKPVRGDDLVRTVCTAVAHSSGHPTEWDARPSER